MKDVKHKKRLQKIAAIYLSAILLHYFTGNSSFLYCIANVTYHAFLYILIAYFVYQILKKNAMKPQVVSEELISNTVSNGNITKQNERGEYLAIYLTISSIALLLALPWSLQIFGTVGRHAQAGTIIFVMIFRVVFVLLAVNFVLTLIGFLVMKNRDM